MNSAGSSTLDDIHEALEGALGEPGHPIGGIRASPASGDGWGLPHGETEGRGEGPSQVPTSGPRPASPVTPRRRGRRRAPRGRRKQTSHKSMQSLPLHSSITQNSECKIKEQAARLDEGKILVRLRKTGLRGAFAEGLDDKEAGRPQRWSQRHTRQQYSVPPHTPRTHTASSSEPAPRVRHPKFAEMKVASIIRMSSGVLPV